MLWSVAERTARGQSANVMIGISIVPSRSVSKLLLSEAADAVFGRDRTSGHIACVARVTRIIGRVLSILQMLPPSGIMFSEISARTF
jgi:hypothetical protein